MRKSVIASLILLAMATSALAVDHYTVTKLPIGPTAINNKGHIAGTVAVPKRKGYTACLWINGKLTLLDPQFKFDWPEGPNASIAAMNDNDEIIGQKVGEGAVTTEHSFYYKNRVIVALEGGSGMYGTGVSGINNRRQIVGTASGTGFESSYDDALFWPEPNSAPENLGTKYGWRSSTASAINDRGDITGFYIQWECLNCVVGPHRQHCIILSKGRIVEIKPPVPLPDEGTIASVAINNHSQVLFYCWQPNRSGNARMRWFVWQAGKSREITGNEISCRGQNCINDRGQVVGQVEKKGTKVSVGFLWEKGHMYDLNTLIRPQIGLKIIWALGINNLGQIICSGKENRKEVGLLLTPVVNHPRHQK